MKKKMKMDKTYCKQFLCVQCVMGGREENGIENVEGKKKKEEKGEREELEKSKMKEKIRKNEERMSQYIEICARKVKVFFFLKTTVGLRMNEPMRLKNAKILKKTNHIRYFLYLYNQETDHMESILVRSGVES